MNYDDLRFAIKRRDQLKKQNNLKEDIEFTYNKYCVQTYLEVLLPEMWEEMKEDFISLKYPKQSNPVAAFVEPDYKADFLIQKDPSILVIDEDVQHFKDSIKNIIMRLQPANTFLGDGKECNGGLKISWFDFSSYGLDGMVYNLIFFTAVKGCLFIGSFHCRELESANWKPLFLKVMKMLKYVEVSDES